MAPDVMLNSSKIFCITFHLPGEMGTTTKNTKTVKRKFSSNVEPGDVVLALLMKSAVTI